MKAKKIAIVAVVLVAIVISAYVYLQNAPSAASQTGSEYISLSNADIRAVSSTTTSIVATSELPLTKKFTIYTPADAKDGRVEIEDVSSGKKCVSDNYLVQGISVTKDGKTARIHNFSGSNQYIDTIDTDTCMPIAGRQVLSQ